MQGQGKLKKEVSLMNVNDIPQAVVSLKAPSLVEQERAAHLVDVLATHHKDHPKALVSAGAIGPLVELVASGSDGSQIHAASTLATLAQVGEGFQEFHIPNSTRA